MPSGQPNFSEAISMAEQSPERSSTNRLSQHDIEFLANLGLGNPFGNPGARQRTPMRFDFSGMWKGLKEGVIKPFFTKPFENGRDFTKSLFNFIIIPAQCALALLTAVAVFASAIILAIGGLLAAALTATVGQFDISKMILGYTELFAIAGGVALVASIGVAIALPLTPLVGIAQFGSRSVHSVIKAVKDRNSESSQSELPKQPTDKKTREDFVFEETVTSDMTYNRDEQPRVDVAGLDDLPTGKLVHQNIAKVDDRSVEQPKETIAEIYKNPLRSSGGTNVVNIYTDPHQLGFYARPNQPETDRNSHTDNHTDTNQNRH